MTKKKTDPEPGLTTTRPTGQWTPDEEIDDRTRRIIWRGADHKSVRELAAETGLTPEQVFSAKKQIFEEIDHLTLQEQQMKAIVTMREIAEKAYEQIDNTYDERNIAGVLNASVNAQKEVLKQVRALAKEDDSKVEALNAMRIRELLGLMNAVVSSGCDELSEQYGIDRDELEAVFTERLVVEARNREIDKL